MHAEIAIAQNNDIPSMVELLNELFTQDIEFIPNEKLQQRGLGLIVNNAETGEILVLKVDGKTVGMVSLLYSISTALGGKVAILEDMIIQEKFRAQGFGSKLIDYAINFAKRRNCLRITLLTDYNNEPAMSFYQKFGFEKSAMIPFRLII
jgi:GNAT superfamily N-acetyltransferase